MASGLAGRFYLASTLLLHIHVPSAAPAYADYALSAGVRTSGNLYGHLRRVLQVWLLMAPPPVQ
ncbi:hypothetical protein E2C01_024224 [Portunus trituberculatus]|uniref:Secreted protein n=1 Tax=Portunus trituberculatus TaxID=210409 RepID=A0A5B7EA36_PORTR|nr:hypothetical protein [Portunus trituberculatus]